MTIRGSSSSNPPPNLPVAKTISKPRKKTNPFKLICTHDDCTFTSNAKKSKVMTHSHFAHHKKNHPNCKKPAHKCHLHVKKNIQEREPPEAPKVNGIDSENVPEMRADNL